jgi:hypothetical protein
LSDKAETIGAPASGTITPRPPEIPPKNRRKKKRKARKLSCRIDYEIQAALDTRMAETGCSESEAARQLIAEGVRCTTKVIIVPNTPPEHVEMFLGEIRNWRRDFQQVKSRLNAPLPTNPDDKELRELVVRWRTISADLLDKIPALEEKLEVIIDALTGLTAKRIGYFGNLSVILESWIEMLENSAREEGESADSPGVNLNTAWELKEIMGFLAQHGLNLKCAKRNPSKSDDTCPTATSSE